LQLRRAEGGGQVIGLAIEKDCAVCHSATEVVELHVAIAIPLLHELLIAVLLLLAWLLITILLLAWQLVAILLRLRRLIPGLAWTTGATNGKRQQKGADFSLHDVKIRQSYRMAASQISTDLSVLFPTIAITTSKSGISYFSYSTR
ncbi:MAG TPA: hypothetical protein VN824_23125, partial [Puia sp.]|nr:hypothetical protein [Puia sp.]